MLGIRFGYTLTSLGLWAAAACTSAPASYPGDGQAPPIDVASGVADAPALSAGGQDGSSAPESIARLYASIDTAREVHLATADEAANSVDAFPLERATGSGSSLRTPLPGRSARTVLREDVNEAENLFFTEDGRLFVSGAEGIYEIERATDGTFTKTNHFDEDDCVVEGITHNGDYLYGVCWTLQLDLSVRSFLIGGQLTEEPVFRIIDVLDKDVVANGMTVDAEGRVYVTYTTDVGQIVRLTFSAPLQLSHKEIWASDLPNVNGIKYVDGAMYATLLDSSLTSEFVRIPVLGDGSAGEPETLFERWLTVLDDFIPFEDGFVITDFLKGTLIFWNETRGVYAETPGATFYGPTSLARGRPPMFTDDQLLVAEKGTFLVRDEIWGDLLSMYQLP